MTDDTEEDEAPVVELGPEESVAGAPLARISSRLTYGIEKSVIRHREGDTEIRTADGPRRLGGILEEIDQPYFERRQAFESAVRDVIPDGPVPTE